MEEIRLQKFLAMANVASRRTAEVMITDGRVTVNGELVNTLGTKVLPGDLVCVDRQKVEIAHKKHYIMLNKPVGYVTTAKDEFGRKTIFDLVTDVADRLFSVGRLDSDTEGLIFLTNDGDFTYKITHPAHNIEKTYVAKVRKIPTAAALEQLRNGVMVDAQLTAKAHVQVLKVEGNCAVIEMKIHEGRNRQVRKMFEAVGHSVISLKRVAIGGIFLGNLPVGKWRHLANEEILKINSEIQRRAAKND